HDDRALTPNPAGSSRTPGGAGDSWPEMVSCLDAAGIAVPSWRILEAGESAQQACAGLAAPSVVKALPGDAAHKSELGLLALNLTDADEVEHEATRLRSILGRPDAGLLVQEMVGDG